MRAHCSCSLWHSLRAQENRPYRGRLESTSGNRATRLGASTFGCAQVTATAKTVVSLKIDCSLHSHHLNVFHSSGIHRVWEGRETDASGALKVVQDDLGFGVRDSGVGVGPYMVPKRIHANNCSLLEIRVETFEGHDGM